MILFTRLCVELQRSSFAKDGLYQYRNICKDASLHSFEVVVKKFLELANSKANDARQESEQTASTLQDIEDLDYMQTPERWVGFVGGVCVYVLAIVGVGVGILCMYIYMCICMWCIPG